MSVFSGNYQKALETYKEIHRKFPENVECKSPPSLRLPLQIPLLMILLLNVAEIIEGSAHTCPGLRFLVRLCTDMGLKEVQDYATKLKKAEKMKEIREQVRRLQA